MTFQEACASARFSHARFRMWCGVGQVHVYLRDPESPTGVMLAATMDAVDGADAILRQHGRAGALSPVEPR